MTENPIDIPPKQMAALKKQLKVVNARLLAIEREREQLRTSVAELAALLKTAT